MAAIVLAIGSSAIAEFWARTLYTFGYETPDFVVTAFANFQPGSLRTILLVALLGPLIEETLFRAFLQRILLWFYRPTTAVLVVAVVFAAAHLNLMQFGPALWMGLVTGAIFARTSALWLCVLWHAIYNLQFMLPPGMLGLAPLEARGFLFSPAEAIGLGVRGALFLVGLLLLWRAINAVPTYLRPVWTLKVSHEDAAPISGLRHGR